MKFRVRLKPIGVIEIIYKFWRSMKGYSKLIEKYLLKLRILHLFVIKYLVNDMLY